MKNSLPPSIGFHVSSGHRQPRFGLAALIGLAAVASACSSHVDDSGSSPVGELSSADKIAQFEDPSGLLGNVSRRLADNITVKEIGWTYGPTDERAPYPDTYWPMDRNGIDLQWNGTEKSPLEKYTQLDEPALLPSIREWNRVNAGSGRPGVASWFGICNGWAGAAVSETPVLHAVWARRAGSNVQACSPGEPGCIKFEIGDINALLATIYTDGGSRFIGGRCDTPPDRIVRDPDGRVSRTGNGAGCKGLNPGALMVVLAHRMKRDRAPMVVDVQTPTTTNQIWNQPAYRYTVRDFAPISEAEATNLVVSGNRTGLRTKYRWNDEAKGFAYVDLDVWWVTENGPNTTFVSGVRSSRATRMTAVLELDRPASDPAAEIIGGELTSVFGAGTDRLTNHPFVWIPNGPRADGTRRHNPQIKSSIVKQLAALGQR